MERSNIQSAIYQVSEVELIYKSKMKASDRPKIVSSKDAYDILMHCWNENKLDLQEQFKVLFLNRANKVLGVFEVSSGGITGTVADPRLIFTAALKMNASSLVLHITIPAVTYKRAGQMKN